MTLAARGGPKSTLRPSRAPRGVLSPGCSCVQPRKGLPHASRFVLVEVDAHFSASDEGACVRDLAGRGDSAAGVGEEPESLVEIIGAGRDDDLAVSKSEPHL